MNLSVRLTNLESNLVADLAGGFEYKEIAAKKNRSVYTIENEARKIKEKTGARNIAQLISWYYITTYKILISFLFLAITFSQLIYDDPTIRARRVRQSKCRIAMSRTRRSDEEPVYLNGFDIE